MEIRTLIRRWDLPYMPQNWESLSSPNIGIHVSYPSVTTEAIAGAMDAAQSQ